MQLSAAISQGSSHASPIDVAAAALFRKSSREPTKKSTRPLSKEVFTSLKLTTEDWVRLEAEAKDYMLDETHPERQACVGQRANVTANDTKLQLFKTVQQFLASGAGIHYFGRSDDDEPGSKWVYPRDEDRLILLMTPLMRRMVTNERQRRYAYRTRHIDRGKSVDAAPKTGDGPELFGNESQYASTPTLGQDAVGHSYLTGSGSVPSTLDVGLESFQIVFLDGDKVVHRSVYPSQYMYSITFEGLFSMVQEQMNAISLALVNASLSVNQKSGDSRTESNEEDVRRSVLQRAAAAAAAQVPVHFDLLAHLRDGLHRIDGEEDWGLVKTQVRETPWMTGSMKLVVFVHDGVGVDVV
jgi:hypothetical protein